MKKLSILIFMLLTILSVGCSNEDNPELNSSSDTALSESDNKTNDQSSNDNSVDSAFEKWIEQYPNPLSGEKFTEFETLTFDKISIDNSVFENSEITLINLWASYCNPCIEEMPELEKLASEYSLEEFQIIGILSDSNNDTSLETAKEIVSKTNVTYTNILIDENIINQLLDHFNFVPVTIFVDNKGNILPIHIPSAGNYDTFKLIIDHLLNK